MLGSATQCPAHIQESLRLYVMEGLLPGSFLQAVLANDLMAAFGHGDPENLECETMQNILAFVRFEIPSACHGSRENIRRWHQRFRDGKLPFNTGASR